MFLSRLTFNTRSSLARRQLTQPYQLHRTLLKAFPEGGVHIPRSSAEAHGVLYRMETHPTLHIPCVLVQSVSRPDWTTLETMGDEGGEPFVQFAPECRSFSPDVEAGALYAFRLRANPTKRVSETGKRVGLYHDDEQLRWLHRRLYSLEFFAADDQSVAVRIVQAFVSKEGDVIDRTRQNEQIARITLTSVLFDGFLEAINPMQVAALMRSGIGSAKGFGFGLLSLRRIR